MRRGLAQSAGMKSAVMQSGVKRLRNIGLAAILAVTFFSGVVNAGMPSDKMAVAGGETVAGVPEWLAASRRQQMDSLEYQLLFNLPEDPTQDICGTVAISFSPASSFAPERESGELLIDFHAPQENVKSLKVNGKSAEIAFNGDHIAIDKRLLAKEVNTVEIDFIAGERPLNRREDFIYTLFVPDRARYCFPCFDQPDLKARYTLTLELPEEWRCVSNTEVASDTEVGEGRRRVTFLPTQPLSTYLFAFVAGKFEYEKEEIDGHTFGIYHRETDEAKRGQLPEIAREVAGALTWLEDYTAIPYPFGKYDIIILPGFQFGGMEHAGATLYNDRRMFLNANADATNVLSRNLLVAHETAHMWFGDLVTMRWFNDVWTKEVFANYYAAAICRALHPEDDGTLAWVSSFLPPAMAEDRTAGATSIRQDLDNLSRAGLVYNNIIYDKSPIMMRSLVQMAGEENFREAIREYLTTYSYANATWNELVEILQSHSDRDIRGFSKYWVDEAGRPEIFLSLEDDCLVVSQYPSSHCLPQQFEVTVTDGDCRKNISVATDGSRAQQKIQLPPEVASGDRRVIIPNSDGYGYAIFRLADHDRDALLAFMADSASFTALPPYTRLAVIINMNECRHAGALPPDRWAQTLLSLLACERDATVTASLASSLASTLPYLGGKAAEDVEKGVYDLAMTHPVNAVKTALLRVLMQNMTASDAVKKMYDIWEEGKSPLLNESDMTSLALELALRMPESHDDIIAKQRSRLSNPDRLADFDFEALAVSPEREKLDACFNMLKEPANRVVEPRAQKTLSLLCHRMRGKEAARYVYPALEILPDIQATGDIFFPMKWCSALLSGQYSPEASAELKRYLDNNPDINSLLKNKILIAGHHLLSPGS